MREHLSRSELEPSEPLVAERGDAEGDPTRREAVRRLGNYAAYTAPALVALLTATRASAGS